VQVPTKRSELKSRSQKPDPEPKPTLNPRILTLKTQDTLITQEYIPLARKSAKKVVKGVYNCRGKIFCVY
jgi:hypothetical protein